MKKLKFIDWLMIIFITVFFIVAYFLRDIHQPSMSNKNLNGYPF